MSGNPRLPVITEPFKPRPLPEQRPGQLEKAVRDLWTPAMRRRLLQPRHWPDWWRLSRNYDLREITARELRIDFPIGRLPDCESCTEVCCTGPMRVVLLRLVDVAALVDAGLGDMMTLDKPAFGPDEVRRNVALQDMINSEAWRRLPVLKQDGTRTCALLTEDNRCGAYPFWPLSCARFPYSLDVLRGRIFYADSCPTAVQDVTRLGRARERELMDRVVEAYNQRVRDAVLMRVARRELAELGLAPFLRLD